MGQVNEYLLAAIAIFAVTGAAWLIQPFTGYQSVALFYLLLVVSTGLRLSRAPVVSVAAISAVLWNFLFVPPRFTIFIEQFHDAMMFVTFFAVAIAMGHLTSQLRRNEITERQRERRTAALYELARQAAFSRSLDVGLRAAVNLIDSIFAAKSALLLRQSDHSLSEIPHPASSFSLSVKEMRAATWAFAHGASAGKFTLVQSESEALHMPLRGRAAIMGVLSVQPPKVKSFDVSERELLEAFAVLIGLVLEKDHIIEAFKRAEILEASEHLRRALLESVSHELKTPLAAVQAGIDTLSWQVDNKDARQATLREVQLAVRRLHRVINNLLNMTRIESGVIQPNFDWCEVVDIMNAAVDLAGESLSEHRIMVDADPGLPMMKLDQPLLEQCLCNLLLNSAANSPPGSKILLRAYLTDRHLVLSVSDEGRGIRQEDMPRIFEMFYRGKDASAGGTGLGLAIVNGFVRAHGGTVRAVSGKTGGAEFLITLPVETLPPEIVESLA